ncbi:hypothetical protein QE152_g25496 [Popillia japonica]|uniref:Uncharacterized protein n=1 Tax=Popillia japonica TaxID=7064 RepID=A0AAW1K1I8_POPJA
MLDRDINNVCLVTSRFFRRSVGGGYYYKIYEGIDKKVEREKKSGTVLAEEEDSRRAITLWPGGSCKASASVKCSFPLKAIVDHGRNGAMNLDVHADQI